MGGLWQKLVELIAGLTTYGTTRKGLRDFGGATFAQYTGALGTFDIVPAASNLNGILLCFGRCNAGPFAAADYGLLLVDGVVLARSFNNAAMPLGMECQLWDIVIPAGKALQGMSSSAGSNVVAIYKLL